MNKIDRIFSKFINKRISLWRTTVSMAVIHFGTITKNESGCYGELAIHLQCSWRIRNNKRIITGNMDQYQPAKPLTGTRFSKWYSTGKWVNNLMTSMINKSLHVSCQPNNSSRNRLNNPIVVNAEFSKSGDITIKFSNNLSLETFINSSHGEAIRIIDLINNKHYAYESFS